MDKIICDLCGTSYPDTASQCPICGTARSDASKQQSADMSADAYAYVRGGRFSKSNVRKRNSGRPENRRQPAPAKSAPAKAAPVKPVKPQEGKNPAPQPQEEDGGSNRGLVIVVVVLLLAIIGMVAFVAMKFIDLNNAGGNNSTGSSNVGNASQIPCKGLHLDQTELVFTSPNKTVLLQALVNPVNTTDVLSYSSSDESVVKVDADGLVTPVADGEAVIIITCGDHKLECKVTCEMGITVPPETDPPATEPDETEPPETEPPVTEPPATEPDDTTVTGFCLNRVDFTLNGYGASWNLTLNSPDQFGNTYEGPADPSLVTWTSENPNIATVENGVVTAVGNGKTNIIAEYNGKSRQCIVRCVNVTAPVAGEEVAQPLYKLNYTDVTLNVGEEYPLRLTDIATGANVAGVTYTVADETVCSVDENGKFKALESGIGRSTKITVEYDGQTFTCIVRVRAA